MNPSALSALTSLGGSSQAELVTSFSPLRVSHSLRTKPALWSSLLPVSWAALLQHQSVAFLLLSCGWSCAEPHPSRQADTARCLELMFKPFSVLLGAVSRATSTEGHSQPWEGIWDELWKARDGAGRDLSGVPAAQPSRLSVHPVRLPPATVTVTSKPFPPPFHPSFHMPQPSCRLPLSDVAQRN